MYLRLAAMMFGQYFIWGAWYVTMGTYLTKIGFQGIDIGRAYGTTTLASVLSSFIVGRVADRYFAAQKLTGWLHLGGAVLIYWASTIRTPGLFLLVLMAYAIFYAPTLALTATIGMRHCSEPEKQYPRIRVQGTLGWIVAGLAISFLGLEFGPQPMQIAAAASVLLGLYSSVCPTHRRWRPPKRIPPSPPFSASGHGLPPLGKTRLSL
jgi:MFS family permease